LKIKEKRTSLINKRKFYVRDEKKRREDYQY